MGILDKIKKEEPSLSNLDSQQNSFIHHAILQDKQIEDFVRNLTAGPSSYKSLINTAYEKTGKKALTQQIKGTRMYGIVKKIKKDPDVAHIASFEALLKALYPCPADFPGEDLKLGEGKIFDEEKFVIKYFKEEPLKRRGRWGVEGIIQVLYQSPIGGFVIRQHRINDKIFEISVSPNISKKLLQEINTALEKTLDLEPESMEKQFRRELEFQVENSSLVGRQQEEVKGDIPPGIEDSTRGISH